MKDKLLKIIKHYGVLPQLKYFQGEVFELNEAIIDYEWTGDLPEVKHIKEEIADVMVMLKQFQEYYMIKDEDIIDIMEKKIDRQLERIEAEGKNNEE